MSLNPSQPGDGPRVRITEIVAERVPQTFASSGMSGTCNVPDSLGHTMYVGPSGSQAAPAGSDFVLYPLWEAGTMDFQIGPNFTWTKDGVALPDFPSNIAGVLALLDAQVSDSGLYKCVFNGRCGTDYAEVNITVT